jgi:hypothetical protein
MTSALLDLRHGNMQPALTRHNDFLQFARTDHTIADGVSTSSYQWPSHTADSVAHLLVLLSVRTLILLTVCFCSIRLTVSTWSSWRHAPVRIPDSLHLFKLLTVCTCSYYLQCAPAYAADNAIPLILLTVCTVLWSVVGVSIQLKCSYPLFWFPPCELDFSTILVFFSW